MTRINAGIPVEQLSKPHLIAEHREITRIPNAIKSGKANLDNIPSEFTLGNGHVKFFYDKLLYLKRRYLNLYLQCRRRNINVENKMSAFTDLPDHLMGDYNPTERDRAIVRERIDLRLRESDLKNKFKQQGWCMDILRDKKADIYMVYKAPLKKIKELRQRQQFYRILRLEVGVSHDLNEVEQIYEKNFAESLAV